MKESKRKLPTHLNDHRVSKCFVFRHPNYLKRKSVLFTYANNGDKEAVEKKAIRFTLKMNAKLGPVLRKSSKGRMTSRNQSGIVNVDPKRDPARRNGLYYYFWVARWKGCQKKGGVSWPCLTHTDNGAYVLAKLTLDMKTTDRNRVLEEFEKTKGTPRYKDILRHRPANKPIEAFWKN